MSAFSPNAVGTYRFTVGATAMTVQLPVRPGTIRVFNNTPANILYIEIGGATALVPVAATGTGNVNLAAAGSMPLAGGAGSIPLLLEKGAATQISMVASGASTDVYITLGLGDTVG
jgi:hypothetical protein